MTPPPVPFRIGSPAPKHTAAPIRAQPQTVAGWRVAFPDSAKQRAARDAAAHAIVEKSGAASVAGDPQRLARAIESDPIFVHAHHASQRADESLWSRFWRAVGDAIGRVLQAIFGKAKIGRDASSSIGFLALLLAFVVFTWVLARIVRANLADRRRTVPDDDAVRGADPAMLLASADARAASGDFAGATTQAFLAALARLDRAGIVSYDATLTPNEYRRRVRSARPNLADPFDALARAFVPAAYDDRPLDAMHYARARGAYDALARASTV